VDALWICGGTDAGKTTIARLLALTWTLALYEYDRTDIAHHRRLAETSDGYRDFLEQSPEERWLGAPPEALAERALRSFEDRFPLVLHDLEGLAQRGRPVLVEGFGLTADLVAEVEPDRRRVVFLFPTEAFKRESWARRGKPGFPVEVSDAARARDVLWARDMLLNAALRAGAEARGFDIIEVDGSRSAEQSATLLAERFRPYLRV
jgi:hypothetical protein